MKKIETKKNSNGEGSIYQRKDGRWVAALQVGFTIGGKQDVITKYAKTEQEAKQKLKEMKQTAYLQTPEARKKQTVEKYIMEWFPRYKKNLKPAAYDRQEETIKYQILPIFGHYQIHNVVSSDIKDGMNYLQYEKKYSYSTVKKTYDALNECFRQAVDDGVIAKNPCNKQNKPMKIDFISLNDNDYNVRYLLDDEIDRFCKEALRVYKDGKPVYRLGYAFILILNTGIRLGEALALRRNGDIDLVKNRMIIDSNISLVKNRDKKDCDNNYKFIEVVPKTKNSRRILPLNESAVYAAKKLIELNENHEFLLSTSEGNLINPQNFERTLKCILKKAKIDDCGVHALRHTYASALFKKKVDIKLISSLLGHSNVKITYDTYVHLSDDQLLDAVNSVDLSKSTATAIIS